MNKESQELLALLGDESIRVESLLFSERYLLERRVLKALRSSRRSVLLIDEVDRADPELEAVLLETLAEGQITVPELGTLRGETMPLVLLTSNGTREMTDALRRRCLHLFVDYPLPSVEMAIVRLRVPGVEDVLLEKLTGFLQRVRQLPLRKAPSVSEAIDWARASLLLLGRSSLDPELVRDTLGVIAKHDEDRAVIEAKLGVLLGSLGAFRGRRSGDRVFDHTLGLAAIAPAFDADLLLFEAHDHLEQKAQLGAYAVGQILQIEDLIVAKRLGRDGDDAVVALRSRLATRTTGWPCGSS